MREATYHPTRLYWANFRGIRRVDGQEVPLDQPPVLPGGLVIDGLDYVPGVVSVVMPRGQRWRAMKRREVECCRQLLGLDAQDICVVCHTTGRLLDPAPAP